MKEGLLPFQYLAELRLLVAGHKPGVSLPNP